MMPGHIGSNYVSGRSAIHELVRIGKEFVEKYNSSKAIAEGEYGAPIKPEFVLREAASGVQHMSPWEVTWKYRPAFAELNAHKTGLEQVCARLRNLGEGTDDFAGVLERMKKDVRRMYYGADEDAIPLAAATEATTSPSKIRHTK